MLGQIGKETGQSRNVVLLHGGWHCSASWWKVAALLRERGHDVATPDLPGHGARALFPDDYCTQEQAGLASSPTLLPDISLESAAHEIVDLVRRLKQARPDRPLVLVSHSSSGAIASLVGEKAADAIDHLVYIAAIVPTRLVSAMEVGMLPEYGSPTMDGLLVGDPTKIGAMRINPRATDATYRALLRDKFYGDIPPSEADAFVNLLIPDQPQRYLADPVTVTAERWGSIPRTYVHTLHDRSVAPAAQTIMVEDADARFGEHPFRRIRLDTSHCPFASKPADVADAIVADVEKGRR